MMKIPWLLIISFILINTACAEEPTELADMSRWGPPYETTKVSVATNCVSVALSGSGTGCSGPIVIIKPEVRDNEVYLSLYIKEIGNCEAEHSFSEIVKVCGLKPGEYTFYYPQATLVNITPENKG